MTELEWKIRVIESDHVEKCHQLGQLKTYNSMWVEGRDFDSYFGIALTAEILRLNEIIQDQKIQIEKLKKELK